MTARITTAGICNDSYNFFFNFENTVCEMCVRIAPKYNTIWQSRVCVGEIVHSPCIHEQKRSQQTDGITSPIQFRCYCGNVVLPWQWIIDDQAQNFCAINITVYWIWYNYLSFCLFLFSSLEFDKVPVCGTSENYAYESPWCLNTLLS